MARSLGALLLAGLAAPGAAEAQAWTERSVIERALSRAPDAVVAGARAGLARARIEGVGRYPDPAVEVEREQTFGAGGGQETTLAAVIPIDLSGRRAVLRHLARAEAAGAEADATLARRAAVTAALLAFTEVLVAQRRLALATEAVEALEEAARVMALRSEAGSVAGYERTRLELEAEMARSDVADAREALELSGILLLALVAPELRALPPVEGTLATEPPVALARLTAQALSHRGLGDARAAVDAAEEAARAAGTAWIPVIGLTGGLRIEGDGDGRYGYVAGVSVDLPIFSGNRGLPAQASAERALASARADAVERTIRREVTSAHARLSSSHRELERFREAVTPRVDRMRRGAEAGYREGTRSLLELLDAERAAVAARRRELELEARARRAEAELRGAVGAW